MLEIQDNIKRRKMSQLLFSDCPRILKREFICLTVEKIEASTKSPPLLMKESAGSPGETTGGLGLIPCSRASPE